MAKNRFPDITAAAGFTLVDMLMAIALMVVLAAMAVPTLGDVRTKIRLGEGTRQVERVLQGARLKAVTTNRAMRVRINCPTAGHFRMVELIGTPSRPATADGATNRCSTTNYPYPPADTNPMTTPNHDGPVNQLHADLSFSTGSPAILEFWPDGSVHADTGDGQLPWKPLSGTGTAITIIKGSESKSITVNGLGRITLQ